MAAKFEKPLTKWGQIEKTVIKRGHFEKAFTRWLLIYKAATRRQKNRKAVTMAANLKKC